MDNSEKRCSSGRGWRISTPSFPETASMDSFYADAHRLLEQRFTELHECGEQGIFAADYLIREQNGALEVTLRLRRRINGKYTDERRFSHRWRGGVIASGRSHSPINTLIHFIISKKMRVYKGKNKTT